MNYNIYIEDNIIFSGYFLNFTKRVTFARYASCFLYFRKRAIISGQQTQEHHSHSHDHGHSHEHSHEYEHGHSHDHSAHGHSHDGVTYH